MPVDTDPGPPEERTLDSDALSGLSESKKKKLNMFDIQQIWTLSWWKRQRRRIYRERPQSAHWLLPTVWLSERICVCQSGLVESPSPSARPGSLLSMKRGDHCK